MNKKEFLNELRKRANALPEEEILKTTNYYSEMISDRVEDGDTEEEAVEALGSIDEIIKKISQEHHVNDLSVKTDDAVSKKNNDTRTLKIVLAIVTIPIWVPVTASVFAAFVSVAAGLISIACSFIALIFSSFVNCIMFFSDGKTSEGFFTMGLSIFGIGASSLIIMFFGFIIKKIVWLCKKAFGWIKYQFKRAV